MPVLRQLLQPLRRAVQTRRAFSAKKSTGCIANSGLVDAGIEYVFSLDGIKISISTAT